MARPPLRNLFVRELYKSNENLGERQGKTIHNHKEKYSGRHPYYLLYSPPLRLPFIVRQPEEAREPRAGVRPTAPGSRVAASRILYRSEMAGRHLAHVFASVIAL